MGKIPCIQFFFRNCITELSICVYKKEGSLCLLKKQLQMHLSASIISKQFRKRITPALYIFDEMIIAGKWCDP